MGSGTDDAGSFGPFTPEQLEKTMKEAGLTEPSPWLHLCWAHALWRKTNNELHEWSLERLSPRRKNMSQVIYKYRLDPDQIDRKTLMIAIDMPCGASFLSVQEQNGVVCMWALVDDIVTDVDKRHFMVVPTGLPFDGGRDADRQFRGTFQIREEGLVIVNHLFEIFGRK